jgi:two-component system phosphate regulon sensor histidine kinase PhoR
MAGEKVLVVESTPDVCDFIVRRGLLPHGYIPLTVADGAAALASLRETPPSLIIAEAHAPRISGVALASRLQQDDLDIPLILTAEDWPPDLAREALRAGVVDCLIKPLDEAVLSEAIRRALEVARRRRWRAHQLGQRQPSDQARLERLEDLERLTRLGREMTVVLDVDQMLVTVLQMAVNLAEADEGAVLLFDAVSQSLITRAVKEVGDADARSCRTPAEDELATEVFNAGQARLLDSAALPQPVRARMYVPLHSRARLIGVLRVSHHHPDGPFTPYHQRLLQMLADYAAIALENTLLYARTEVERAQLETILKEMVDGVVAVDLNEHLLLVNPMARAMLQVREAEVSGRPLEQVIQNAEVRAFLRGENQRGEIKLDDGRIFNAHSTYIADVGRVLVMQDISTLKELDRIKSEFVNTVSHDLRSPLTAILGYVELIQRVGPVTDQQAEFIHRIQFGVQSITALISDLLDLGRIEAGFDTQKEGTHLAAVVEFSIEGVRAQADIRHQTLDVHVAQPLPLVLANPPRLQQMLTNLVGNAIKYSPPGGRITLTVKTDGYAVVVTVTDTGMGIPPADLPYIFNKFYRASNSREKYEGTGLGLSIVKSIVENHGGRIWVDSKLNEGSTFTVILPQYAEPKPESEA